MPLPYKLKKLKPKPGKEIPFLILITFLLTFVISRTTTYIFPDLFVPLRGTHVHHFAYGIVILAVTNFLTLIHPRSEKTRLRLSLVYGFALGLAFDEFLMWVQLENRYWDRHNLDAVIIVALIILNVVYFDGFWRKWGSRMGNFIRFLSEI